MCNSKTVVILLFSLYLVSISNAANVIYVDVNGPNDPGTGTFDDPFRKIQDAIDAAIDCDIVEIQPGLYTGPGNYNLDPKGLAITIRSIDPNNPDVISNTIIDPNEAGRGFYVHSGEDANCVISGLTIRNGYSGGNGGGIFCYISSPTIANCVISGNYAVTYGGAIFCQSSSPQFISCIITGNSAGWDGGALECWDGMPDFTNCIIADNNAMGGNGGGIDCYSNGDVTLTNCTFVGNSADSGGAVYCWTSNVVVNNSIVWANEADDGSQVAITTGSVSISYSDVQGEWPGTSNIDADPCFASFDPNGDPNKWDFHLQSDYGRWDPNNQRWVTDSNTSPCIDAGDPNSDWSNEP
ncbi:MAG: right-handed parallel beta-helix repeat-containing protein, partial [Sedimentisphaerales bacterium]